MRGVVLDSSIKDWKVVVSTPSPALIESSETCSLLVSISTPDTVSLSELFNNIQQCFRSGVTGRGEAGARLVPRLQQADQTSAEHDSEGSGRVWTGFHSAHQRCKYSLLNWWCWSTLFDWQSSHLSSNASSPFSSLISLMQSDVDQFPFSPVELLNFKKLTI